MESGESPAEAAVREAAEEAGVTVTVGPRVFVDELVYPGGARFRAHTFVARSVTGSPTLCDPKEISSVGWYEVDDPPSPLTPSATAVLPRLAAIRR